MTQNYTLKPKYVVLKDYEEYVEGWTTENSPGLSRMLARAERYVDMLGAGNPIQPCDAIQAIGIKYKSPPTGGTFRAVFTLQGVPFTTTPITFNGTYATVATAINNGENTVSHQRFPGPVQTYEGPLTPFVPSGPLPFTPVVVAFTGDAGTVEIPPGAIVENKLTGGEEVEPFVEQICPGAPWGGRFNPSKLLQFGQLQSLKNAVCAQAEYMYQMGTRFFVEEQYSYVAGPDFTTKGKLPKVAPQARREMALAGLTVSMTRSIP